MLIALFSSLVAASVALLFTPLLRHWAIRCGFVDEPDGQRKVHAQAIALGGGVAVLVATVVGSTVGLSSFGAELEEKHVWSLLGLSVATFLLCVVGIFDDRRPIRGKYKLLWQVLAASLIIGSGLTIDKLTIFGFDLPHLGVFGVLLTMVWLLAATNSFNLIDGVDGLASSVGLVFSFSLGAMALLTNSPVDAVVAFAMGGALLGFLPFNVPGAKIYLGDAGSMIIGLVLGTLALKGSIKEAATLAFAAPLAIWAIPMFDSLAAITRRTLTGRSIYATDRGHIHHQLLTRGLAPWQAVLIVSGLCVVTSAAALASLYFRSELLGLMIVLAVIVALVATRIFGHVELLLLNNQLVGLGRSLVPFAGASRNSSVQLQGSLPWERLWASLVESSERFGLCRIKLNVHLPHMHEAFYATWSGRGPADPDAVWQMSVPIHLGGVDVGRLRVVGEPTWSSVNDQIREFLDFAEHLQSQLSAIMDEGIAPAADERREHLVPAGAVADEPKVDVHAGIDVQPTRSLSQN